MDCKQAEQVITMCVDGELDPETEQDLTLHMETCAACRHAFEIERQMKRLVASKAPRVETPAHLAQKIRALLPTAQPPITWKDRLSDIVELHPRPAVAAVAAMLIVTLISVFGYVTQIQRPPRVAAIENRTPPFMVVELVGHHINCPVEIQSDDPEAIEAWFGQRIGFGPETPRISEEAYRLIGAHLCEVLHRKAAYIVYMQAGQQEIPVSVCIIEATSLDLNRLDRVQFNNIQYYTAEYEGEHLVLWNDGNKVYSCISRMQQDELLAMASSIRL